MDICCRDCGGQLTERCVEAGHRVASRQQLEDQEESLLHPLPDDVLVEVFRRLPAVDALRLRRVCRRWQDLLLHPDVWRHRVLSGDYSMAGEAALDVHYLRFCPSGEGLEEKAVLLQRVQRHGVRRLDNVHCYTDFDWALSLLRAAASGAELEELYVVDPREAHTLALLAAPGLRRLQLWGHDGMLPAKPELPAPAFRLQWLRVLGHCGLPHATLRSLLRPHAASLVSLTLEAGMPGSEPWPRCYDGLPALLAECGLTALRSLLLTRNWLPHDLDGCRLQLRQLRAALPAAQVACAHCDGVHPEPF